MNPRTYTHKFDWDEARRRHAEGETYTELAKAFDVTVSAVARACDDALRERSYRQTASMRTPDSRRGQRERANKTGLGFDPRDRFGVTVTCREQNTGNLWTLTRPGLLRLALLDACDAIDEAEGDWKVITISTPRTILADMQGLRVIDSTADKDQRMVEVTLLGRVGRTDLLEPRSRQFAVSA